MLIRSEGPTTTTNIKREVMENLKGIIHDIANKLTISKSINRNLANLLGRDHKEIIRLTQSIDESIQLLGQLKEESLTVERNLPLENIQNIKRREEIKIQSFGSLYKIDIEYRNSIREEAWINLNSYSNDRILCNSIENAKSAGATKVVIEYSLKENHLQLDIKDNGSGMNSSTLDSVGFGYTSKNGEGHGTGTQVIRSMIQELGGSVVWTSIRDLGTCCRLKYRIEKEPKVINLRRRFIDESGLISESQTKISGKRVLVISKSPMDLGIWKEYLNGIGANAMTCEYGEDALSLVYKEVPHCIIFGKEFKDMSAIAWLKIINSEEKYSKIPKLVFITEANEIESLISQYQVDDIINYSKFNNKKIFKKLETIFQEAELKSKRTKSLSLII